MTAEDHRTPLVSVRGLSHSFGPKRVLNDIDLEVREGEIVAIMGSSGGGKTTLLKCISGLITPTSGVIEVDGVDVVLNPEEARKHMGMVFQSAALFDSLNVRDNVLFGVHRWLPGSKSDHEGILSGSLNAVKLEGSDLLLPSELSGGMKKRVGIARALALSPRLMLYDEPTTGLDPITTYAIDELVVTLRREFGMTSLIVTHDVNSVFRTADRVAFLAEGRIAYWGDTEGFRGSGHPAIRELLDKSSATSLPTA